MRTLSGWAVAGAGLWILCAGHTLKDGGTASAGTDGAAASTADARTGASLEQAAGDAVATAPEGTGNRDTGDTGAGNTGKGKTGTESGPTGNTGPGDPVTVRPATFEPAALGPGSIGPGSIGPGSIGPGSIGPAAAGTETGPVVGGADGVAVPWSEIDRVDECMEARVCIDRYLWSLYARTQKVDTVAVPQQVKVEVKRHGRVRTVTRTVSKFVLENFGWKDTAAAGKAKMSPQDYVIGGMDPGFKVRLYHALRMLDEAGLEPGITSAFRDDYRQTIASGRKAQSDRSFHGGSFRGGYGHGLAADIVSVKGDTHAARLSSSDVLWKFVDSHEKELGIGRPYRDFDAPHVGALDGREYLSRRGGAEHEKTAEHGHRRVAALHDHGGAKKGRTAKGSSSRT